MKDERGCGLSSTSLNGWQNSALLARRAFQTHSPEIRPRSPLSILSLRALLVVLGACAFAFTQVGLLRAQQYRSKVPVVGKLTSGNRQQAYSGKVQSLDLKEKILSVNSLHGRQNEIFPIKKKVRVESINGEKMNLSALTPGMAVLIYYDQKSGERTVRNIVVLSSGKTQAKGKPAPSS